MNADRVAAIANAVLYEGYILYPYRASAIKNRQRFNFGVLAPREAVVASGSGAWQLHTECLARVSSGELNVRVRFLHLMTRAIEAGGDASTNGAQWQEAVERDVVVEVSCRELHEQPVSRTFVCGEVRSVRLSASARSATARPRRSPKGGVGQRDPGLTGHHQESICGEVRVRATVVGDGVSKISVDVANTTSPARSSATQGESDLMRSMVSTHVLLHAPEGEFISLLDPPSGLEAAASGCQNIGVWPVLVGDEGERDAMLASPIILYDYPQIAPESAGDFFDGTEIDEMLVLRILTMTDKEKEEMRAGDPRARRLLEQTESLPPEHVLKLHGVLRGLAPQSQDDKRDGG